MESPIDTNMEMDFFTMPPDDGNITVCEDTSQIRIVFISIGTCLSVLGCLFNGVLLYIFIGKTQRRYPFQTFLAFLDFMLCALYIHCFGLLSISVEYKIAFLYKFVMESNVTTLVMSRIVQLSIPYTLIANSAEKLAMILGVDCESKFSWRLRIGVILALLGTATALRINGIFLFVVYTEEKCDFFHSKWLSHTDLIEKWTPFESVLTFFHTFVSFVLLCALNIVVVGKLRVQHRKTRRQSTSPAQLFSSTTARNQAAQEIREQQHRIRCAVKTTVVIISAYLACNLMNFVLYLLETFRRSWIQVSSMIEDVAFLQKRMTSNLRFKDYSIHHMGLVSTCNATMNSRHKTEKCMFQEENGGFEPFYVIISDLGSNLFVFSSTIRIFIYYKYNAEIKKLIKDIWVVNYVIQHAQPPKSDALLKIEKVDV